MNGLVGKSCVDRILALPSIRSVYNGIREPGTFIRNNNGITQLRDSGLNIVEIENVALKQKILEVTFRGHIIGEH